LVVSLRGNRVLVSKRADLLRDFLRDRAVPCHHLEGADLAVSSSAVTGLSIDQWGRDDMLPAEPLHEGRRGREISALKLVLISERLHSYVLPGREEVHLRVPG